jgi:hypothetical protein
MHHLHLLLQLHNRWDHVSHMEVWIIMSNHHRTTATPSLTYLNQFFAPTMPAVAIA